MSASTYEVKKKVTGGYSVSYSCPHCSAALVSKLQEAGKSENCPTCQRPFVVPGKAELTELERKAALAAEQKAAHERQVQAEKKRAAEEAAKARQLADQQRLEQRRLEFEQEQRAKEQERQGLLVKRRESALQSQGHVRMPFGLWLAQSVLAIAAVLNLICAVIAAITVIGIPIAIGCAISFVVCFAASELITVAHDIRVYIGETVKHQRFQSSVLEGIYNELRKEPADKPQGEN